MEFVVLAVFAGIVGGYGLTKIFDEKRGDNR